jgi:hypothetical protein
VIVELRAESTPGDEVDLEPLTLTRSATPGILPVLAQTLTTLVVVFIASQVFVAQLEWAGPQLGLSSAVVALLLAPVATELPEVMNALIWVRQGKTQLALSNMSGSMMVQTTVPSGLALLYTSWDLNGPLLLSGGVTAAAVVFLLVALRRNRLSARWLAGAAGFYLDRDLRDPGVVMERSHVAEHVHLGMTRQRRVGQGPDPAGPVQLRPGLVGKQLAERRGRDPCRPDLAEARDRPAAPVLVLDRDRVPVHPDDLGAELHLDADPVKPGDGLGPEAVAE